MVRSVAALRLMFPNWSWVSLSMMEVDINDNINDGDVSYFQLDYVSLSLMKVDFDDGTGTCKLACDS